MRLYLVRRTRSFIKNNYAETDPPTGRKYLTFPMATLLFPDRIPKRVEYEFDPKDPKDHIYAKLYSNKVVDTSLMPLNCRDTDWQFLEETQIKATKKKNKSCKTLAVQVAG
jgi:hypothetical protein